MGVVSISIDAMAGVWWAGERARVGEHMCCEKISDHRPSPKLQRNKRLLASNIFHLHADKSIITECFLGQDDG